MGKNISYYKGLSLSGRLEKDIAFFADVYKFDAMLRIRRTVIGKAGVPCALLFMDGMASGSDISEHILRAAVKATVDENFTATPEAVANRLLYSSEVEINGNVADMLSAISYGDTVMLIDKSDKAIIINTKGFKHRDISEPPNERTTTGPREGFDEVALFNIALIRRKLQTPDLCVLPMNIGRRTDTKVFICYLDSLADKTLLDKLKEKIKSIDIDGILDVNYISEELCDKRNFLFKTAGTTERPDIAAARMLEGRVAVIVDGSPVVLTVPFLFSENFQSNEDYYQNYFSGSVARILRLISFVIACFAPAAYIAFVSFHAGFLPTFSALAILKLRTGIPFSTLLECVILIVALELLKEACTRSPRDIGTTLSVVGGLVLGEAAVDTRTISAPALIVVALSGLCSAMLPRLRGPILLINLVSSFFAGFFGLLGVFTCICVTIIYILNIESFGTDYTLSLARPGYQNFKDVLFRASWGNMINRPGFNKNKKRQKDETKRR